MNRELFQHVAMMSRLQVDMSNIFMPAPITREELEEREQDPEYRAERAEYMNDNRKDR